MACGDAHLRPDDRRASVTDINHESFRRGEPSKPCRHVCKFGDVTGELPKQLSGLGALLWPERWGELLELGVPRSYGAGAVLMRQGEHGDAVLTLLRGRVKISRLEPDGLELPLAVRYPGEVLGDISVLGCQPRTATVVAVDPCQVRAVSAATFRRFVNEHALSPLITQHSNRRLEEAEQRRAELVALSVFRLLCRELVRHATTDVRGEVVVDLNMPQEEFARLIGASRNSVVQAFHELRTLGIVETRRRSVLIKDMCRLRACAEQGGPGPGTAPAQ